MIEKNFKVKCPQGNLAAKFCQILKCNQSPLICQHPDCSCKDKHKTCFTATMLSNIYDCFQQKRKKHFKLLEPVCKWYQKCIKRFTSELQQISKMTDSWKIPLIGDELQLFQVLYQGKSQNVTKELMLRAISSMSQDQKQDQNCDLQDIKHKLKIQQIQIEKILKSVKSLVLLTKENDGNFYEYTNQLKFSSVLHHPDVKIVNDSTVTTMTNSWPLLALLEPCIQTRKSGVQKFHFRIVKSQTRWIWFGICHKNIVQNCGFSAVNALNGGLYVIRSSNGHTFSHCFKEQHKVQSRISSIELNDVVQICYDSGKKKFTISNLNQNSTTSMSIRHIKGDPLYLLTMLSNKDDEVEYLGEVKQ